MSFLYIDSIQSLPRRYNFGANIEINIKTNK